MRDAEYNGNMTNTPRTDRDIIRSLDDEALDETLPFAVRLGERDALAAAVIAEAARRAEIRMERRLDVEYGSNRYGFTADEISAKHDAAWYESRQTEAEWLAEMGEEVFA